MLGTGGWLLTKVTTFGDLVIAVSLSFGALLGVAIAYTPDVRAMFAEFVLQGIAEAFIAIGRLYRNPHFNRLLNIRSVLSAIIGKVNEKRKGRNFARHCCNSFQ